jgi:hypothetical protein
LFICCLEPLPFYPLPSFALLCHFPSTLFLHLLSCATSLPPLFMFICCLESLPFHPLLYTSCLESFSFYPLDSFAVGSHFLSIHHVLPW